MQQEIRTRKNKDQKITWSRIKIIDIHDDIDNDRYIDIHTDADINYRYHKLLQSLKLCYKFAWKLKFF